MSLQEVMRNLNNEIDRIEKQTLVGIVKAGFFIEGEATKNAPIEFGNLRGSSYTRARADGAEVGFEAEYAVYVHEINKNYNVGSWKYLQRAVDENTQRILDIVRAEARV